MSEELGILDSRAHNVSPAGEPGDTVYQKTTHEVDKDTDFDHDKTRIIRMKLFLSPNKERSLKTLKDVQTMWIPDTVYVAGPGVSTDQSGAVVQRQFFLLPRARMLKRLNLPLPNAKQNLTLSLKMNLMTLKRIYSYRVCLQMQMMTMRG